MLCRGRAAHVFLKMYFSFVNERLSLQLGRHTMSQLVISAVLGLMSLLGIGQIRRHIGDANLAGNN